MNTTPMIGQIDLLALIGATIKTVDSQESIVIPLQKNPTIFKMHCKSGAVKALLDIVIRQTTQPKYGNTHFIKANVGKTNRSIFNLDSSELPRLSPILGNLKPLESRDEPASSLADDDDLPEGDFKGF
ncbi:MAG: hypothetical protein IKY66_01755 [Bacteroidales bacterium]|nr:hypothetical protein [Bacteroidales bacterium]